MIEGVKIATFNFPNKLGTAISIQDLIILETKDALLVADKIKVIMLETSLTI